MHDLEKRIGEWRQTLMAGLRIGPETVDELENHLREHVEQLVRAGLPEPEAFDRAVARLGTAPRLASEFQKLDQGTWWPVKVILGMGVVVTVAMTLLILFGLYRGRPSVLLGAHVFLITMGYTSTFLVGGLGICFVGQRCFSDLSPRREQSLTRVTFRLAGLAAALSLGGVVLGMIWAKAEWGRYWGWDAKELGGLAIVGWLLCFLAAHRWQRVTAGGVLRMSVVGNLVVTLGWFGANLVRDQHNDGTSTASWFLFGMILLHLVVFLAGLAPAGWLRLRRV